MARRFLEFAEVWFWPSDIFQLEKAIERLLGSLLCAKCANRSHGTPSLRKFGSGGGT